MSPVELKYQSAVVLPLGAHTTNQYGVPETSAGCRSEVAVTMLGELEAVTDIVSRIVPGLFPASVSSETLSVVEPEVTETAIIAAAKV
jgi:hypothetical protein